MLRQSNLSKHLFECTAPQSSIEMSQIFPAIEKKHAQGAQEDCFLPIFFANQLKLAGREMLLSYFVTFSRLKLSVLLM